MENAKLGMNNLLERAVGVEMIGEDRCREELCFIVLVPGGQVSVDCGDLLICCNVTATDVA